MENLIRHVKHRNGTYVAMELSEQSKAQLDNYFNMALNLPERIDPGSYHTTIIYSKTPVPDAEDYAGYMSTSVRDRPVARAITYEVFPTKSDGKCLVLRLNFPLAEELNDILTQKHGATSGYAEYKPHITIAYDMKEDVNVEELSVPQFELLYDRVTVKPLEADYVPPNK